MESNWRWNVFTWVGQGTTGRLFARILSGTYAGNFLYRFNGTFAAIVPEPASPGIVPFPILFLGNMAGTPFPYGYDVEPD